MPWDWHNAHERSRKCCPLVAVFSKEVAPLGVIELQIITKFVHRCEVMNEGGIVL
jgi:hypothetical protein